MDRILVVVGIDRGVWAAAEDLYRLSYNLARDDHV